MSVTNIILSEREVLVTCECECVLLLSFNIRGDVSESLIGISRASRVQSGDTVWWKQDHRSEDEGRRVLEVLMQICSVALIIFHPNCFHAQGSRSM
jgi:hypothetical protein